MYLLNLLCIMLVYYAQHSLSQEIHDVSVINDKPIVITAIGNTGVGKSSLLNLFANEVAFEENDTAESVTKISSKKKFHFMGDKNEIEVCLVDTQGLQENSHQDSNNIAQMVDEFRKSEKIDLFLLCLDSGNPRYTEYLDSTIKTFIKIFGNDFLNHVVLVFNKWNYAVYSDKEKTRRQNEFQRIIEDRFDVKDIPCFFIDSYFNRKIERVNQDTGESEFASLSPNVMLKNQKEIFQFLAYLKSKTTWLESTNAKKVKSNMDELQEQLKQFKQLFEEMIINERLKKQHNSHRDRVTQYGPLGIVGEIFEVLATGLIRIFF